MRLVFFSIMFILLTCMPHSNALAMKFVCAQIDLPHVPRQALPYAGDDFTVDYPNDADLQGVYKDEVCMRAVAYGTIEAGDDYKFEMYLRSHPFTEYLELASAGGSVEAAIAIGRIIRKKFIETQTRFPCLEQPGKELTECCISACALLWLSGAKIGRDPQAIFVHRPTAADLGSMEYEVAGTLLRGAEKVISDYFDEMEAPKWLYTLLMSTPSNDLHRLTEADESRLNEYYIGDAVRVGRFPKSLVEWLTSKCRGDASETCLDAEFDEEQLRRSIALVSRSR